MRNAWSIVWVALVVGLWTTCVGGVCWADGDVLTVTQDESSMERVIEQYLKEAHQLTAREKVLENDDLVLVYDMKGDPAPNYAITVDTQSVHKTESGRVVERAVTAQVFTGIKVPAEKSAAVMKAINEASRDSWFFAGYIDDDGEVVIQWNVNVMSQGLHAEYVFDMVARMDKSWAKLWPMITAALQ
ncbi:YbjN domain-containing protein [bacterium]|nr:YbjN domain-containing protein [bacterium]